MAKKKQKLRKRVALDGTVYAGQLADPIVLKRSPINLIAPKVEREASDAFFNVQLFKLRMMKIPSLFSLYGVANDDWSLLAYKLACAHVPGFQIAKSPGAPAVGGRGSGVPIYLEVRKWLRQHRGKTISDACRALTKAGSPLHGLTPSNVRRRYAATDPLWKGIIDETLLFQELRPELDL